MDDWHELVAMIVGLIRDEVSTNLPDHIRWRKDIEKLGSFTGLRCDDFGSDEPSYVKAVATMVSPPRLPDNVPPLPEYFVRPAMVDKVISKLEDNVTAPNTSAVVITGMGGAGKSLIASAVVQSKVIRRNFCHGILWLNDEAYGYNERKFLLNLVVLAKQFCELVLSRFYRQGRVFQYGTIEFKTVHEAQAHFLKWQNKHNLRCLLVMDSAWSLERGNDLFTAMFYCIGARFLSQMIMFSNQSATFCPY